MNAHLRANLLLFGATVVLCCVFYPLILWAIGQLIFPDKASGSLVVDEDGTAIGSRLIAQPFNAPEYFQPRPSATTPVYNASASGGSNYGANNPRLRYRVAQALGPIVKYRSGPKKDKLVGEDIEKWFQQDRFKGEPHIVAQWAETYSSSAQEWVKADKLNSEHVADWLKTHPKEVEEWKKKNPDASESKPEDFAVPFFVSFSQTFPGTWPKVSEQRFEQVTADRKIQENFFDMWLQEHPDVELVQVPADLVMASGSGLDPHITLQNAQYQLDRVVDAWTVKIKADKTVVRKTIEELLNQKAEAPFGGLAGVKLINVLEVNRALHSAMMKLPVRTAGGGGAA